MHGGQAMDRGWFGCWVITDQWTTASDGLAAEQQPRQSLGWAWDGPLLYRLSLCGWRTWRPAPIGLARDSCSIGPLAWKPC